MFLNEVLDWFRPQHGHSRHGHWICIAGLLRGTGETTQHASTFSIDVDTASYANMPWFLHQGVRPPPDSVRVEELINSFSYDYAPPKGEDPFAIHIEVAERPWTPRHRLTRTGIKGKVIDQREWPLSNLVFLLDASGSLQLENKLPIVKQAMKLLVEQLGENDRVARVVCADSSGLVLPSTNGDSKPADQLRAAPVSSSPTKSPCNTSSREASTASCCAPTAISTSSSPPGQPDTVDRGEGEDRRVPERPRVRHGQPGGFDDGEARRQGQRDVQFGARQAGFAKGSEPNAYQAEFIKLVERAGRIHEHPNDPFGNECSRS